MPPQLPLPWFDVEPQSTPIQPTHITNTADAEIRSQFTEDGDLVSPNADFDERIGENVRKVDVNGVTMYSLIDICATITGSKAASQYWRDTKKRLVADGFETQEKILGLKMLAPDGKLRITDAADAETCLRVVQSIPSPKVEPIRQWLAKVAYERLQEQADPGLSARKALQARVERYQAEGKSPSFIEARLMGMMSFKDFQDRLYAACPTIKFGVAINTEYRNLFGGTAQELRERAGLGKRAEVRDTLTVADLHLLGYVEARCAEAFGERGYIGEGEAIRLIDEISSYAAQVRQMSHKAAAPRLSGGAS